MKVVKWFDFFVGVCLVFFVVYWIKVEIYEFVLKNWCIVKVVIIKVQCKLFFNLCKVKKCLGWFIYEEVKMVVDELGVSIKEVFQMEVCMSLQDQVFDLLVDDDESGSFVLVQYLEDKLVDVEIMVISDDWDVNVIKCLYLVIKILDECS